MDHDVVGIGGGLSSMISTLGNVVGVVLGGYFSFKVAKIALRWSGRIGGNAVEAGCGVEASANEDMSPVADDEGPRGEKLARSMAEEAILEGKEIVLRPMSPYERRIVHMELSKNSRVKTESIGEGENRKVIIRPVA